MKEWYFQNNFPLQLHKGISWLVLFVCTTNKMKSYDHIETSMNQQLVTLGLSFVVVVLVVLRPALFPISQNRFL